MRQALVDHLTSLNLGTIAVSSEVPWISGDTPLYLKNLKRVYVNVDQITESQQAAALNGLIINTVETTVTAYMACDAKNLPVNYESAVSSIRAARLINTISGVSRRECDVTADAQGDILITEFEFRFSNLT